MADFFDFLIRHWILSTLFVVLFIALVMNEFKRRLLGFKGLSPQEVVALINRGDAVVVDLRDETEFRQGHIINAKNIPMGLLEARLVELDPARDKTIILCCKTGQVSARAAARLVKEGFARVCKLNGGLPAWQSAELPLERSS